MRDIITKIELAMFETALNAADPAGDYQAKRKALQDLQQLPSSSEPEIKQAIMQRMADLEKEAKSKGVKEDGHSIPPEGTPEYDQFINRGGIDQKSPYDLGGADAYYGRFPDMEKEYGFQKGSPEAAEYVQGYRDTHQDSGMRKDYGSSRSAVTPRRITKTG